MDNIWKIIDEKHVKRPIWKMWGEFKGKYQSYCKECKYKLRFFDLSVFFLVSGRYKSQAESMKKAMKILQQPSFGGLILNSKNQVRKNINIQQLFRQ